MVARRMKRVAAVHIGLLLALGACQTAGPWGGTVWLDDRTFMSLWHTYGHCRTSMNPDEKREDAQRLALATRSMKQDEKPSVPLSESFKRLIEELPPRVSVDPNAMVVACTLYAAEAAHASGRYRTAAELYRVVISTYAKPKYAYYATQARRGLTQIEQDTHFQLDGSEAALIGSVQRIVSQR